MNFFLSSFGLHNPYIVIELPDHAIYPISSPCNKGIDLDYTSLMLGNKYYMDELAFDYVNDKQKFLAPMSYTLNFLKKEGYLSTIDVNSIIAKNNDALLSKVEAISEQSNIWIQVIREQWKDLKSEFSKFQARIGGSEKEFLNTAHFPILNYLASIGEIDNHQKYSSIIKLLESKKKHFTPLEHEIIKAISKPLLAQILINDLLRKHLNTPVLDWDDNQPYYDQIQKFSWNDISYEDKYHQQAKILFNCIIPNLKPVNIEHVVKFINKEKAVVSLRKELWQSIENNVPITDAWYKEFIDRLVKHSLHSKKKMKKFKWLGLALGLIIPGGGAIIDAGVEVGKSILEDKIENNMDSNFEWYYTLQSLVKEP